MALTVSLLRCTFHFEQQRLRLALLMIDTNNTMDQEVGDKIELLHITAIGHAAHVTSSRVDKLYVILHTSYRLLLQI